MGLEGAFLLFTYGLLGPGKGLEFALKVLARVLPHNPRVRYLVAGRLHPNLERHEGRRYLERVREMAEALGVGEAFLLREGYLSEEELYRLAGAADLFLLPYPNLEQVSSGTLSYALALGKAVLSTPSGTPAPPSPRAGGPASPGGGGLGPGGLGPRGKPRAPKGDGGAGLRLRPGLHLAQGGPGLPAAFGGGGGCSASGGLGP